MHLLGRFEVKLVGPILFVLAVGGGVLAANFRAGFVDAAHVVRLEVLANGVDEQVPVVIFLKNRGPFVEQVPTEELKILELFGRFDRQSEVAAALGGTVFAQNFSLGEIVAIDAVDAKSSIHTLYSPQKTKNHEATT